MNEQFAPPSIIRVDSEDLLVGPGKYSLRFIEGLLSAAGQLEGLLIEVTHCAYR